MTKTTMNVIDALMASTSTNPAYGLGICNDTDLGPGTVYPILERLAGLGWVESWPEEAQPSGRPRRRFYRLTGSGRAAVAAAYAERNRRRPRWRTTPGGAHA